MTVPVIVCSNINLEKYPNNTRQSFKNSLPRSLNFTDSSYEIGISSIYLDLAFSKFPEYLLKNPLIFYKLNAAEDTIITPPGLNFLEYVSSAQDLEFLFSQMLGSSSLVRVSETETSYKMVLSGYGLSMDYKLANFIGIDNIGTHQVLDISLSYGRRVKYLLTQDAISFKKEVFITDPSPKVIQIIVNEIEPIPTTSGFSKSIASIPMSDFKKNNQQSLTMEFKRNQYFSTKRSLTTALHIELLDEKNEPVKFGLGQANIVVLNIRPKMNDSFIISTKSSDSMDKFKSNTASDFVVELPSPITFDGDWETMLTVADLPGSINLSKYISDDYYTYYKQPNSGRFKVSSSEIYTANDLIEPLKKSIEKTLANSGFNIEGSRVEVDLEIDSDTRVKVTSPITATINFSPKLSQLFGVSSILTLNLLENEQLDLGKLNMASLRPQVAMIHTNFSSHVIWGNKMSQIIKIIPLHPTSENNLYENESNNFVQVNTSYLSKIHIKIFDITNNVIDFKKDSISVINFIFRKM